MRYLMMYKNCVARKKPKNDPFRDPKKMAQSEARRDEEYADALTHRARLIADVECLPLVIIPNLTQNIFLKHIKPGSSTRSVVREPNDAMRSQTLMRKHTHISDEFPTPVSS